jgi:molecular chaperone DnaK
VGTLQIKGDDHKVTMDVPAGSLIDVRLSVDESRKYEASAYVPLLDQEFSVVFVGEYNRPSLEDMASRLETVKYQLSNVEKFQSGHPVAEVGETIATIHSTRLVESIDEGIAMAKAGDLNSTDRAFKRILELETTVDHLNYFQRRGRIEVAIEALRKAVQGNERDMLDDIVRDYAGAATDEQIDQILTSISDLEFRVRGRPWNDLLIDIRALGGLRVSTRQNEAFNKASSLFDRIVEKGGISVATDADIASLQSMHRELMDVYPNLYELRQKVIDGLGTKTPGIEGDIESIGKVTQSRTPGR